MMILKSQRMLELEGPLGATSMSGNDVTGYGQEGETGAAAGDSSYISFPAFSTLS